MGFVECTVCKGRGWIPVYNMLQNTAASETITCPSCLGEGGIFVDYGNSSDCGYEMLGTANSISYLEENKFALAST